MMLMLRLLCFGDVPGHFNVLSKELFGKLYVDKGYISKALFETINDELKNIAHTVHSRHRGLANFLMNMISTIMAYCFFPKKTAIKWVIEKQNQLELFI